MHSSTHIYIYIIIHGTYTYIYTYILSHTRTHTDIHNDVLGFSPKGWYHNTPPLFSLAPPSFNLKVYSEKHCFTTLNNVGQMSCTIDALLRP